MKEVNNYWRKHVAIDYGHCDRCGCALIQFSPDDMCMLCELHLDIEWNLRHKDDVNNEI